MTNVVIGVGIKCLTLEPLILSQLDYLIVIIMYHSLDRFWNLYFNFLSTECLEIRKSFRKLKEGFLDPSAIQLGDIRKAVLLKEPVENCLLRIKNIIEFSNEVSRLI